MPAGVLPQQRASPPEGERMLAVQERLPLVRLRTRSARRPFTPSQGRAGYRLPHEIRDLAIAQRKKPHDLYVEGMRLMLAKYGLDFDELDGRGRT